MLTTRIQVRKRECGSFRQLTLNAGRELDRIGRAQVGRNLINRRGRNRRYLAERWRVLREEGRINDNRALLSNSVQAIRLLNEVIPESVVKDSKTTAQHGLRYGLAIAAQPPRNPQARRDIRVVMNIV